MKISIRGFVKKLKSGKFKVTLARIKWIYQYARNHFWAMFFYTLLGLSGTVVSLGSSLVSKNLVDVITGHKSGQVVTTFCIMIGMNLGSTFLTLISGYVSNKINLRVDMDIKADIFSKIIVTDWESLSKYHTGDLLVRWNSDSANIANGVLNFIPNIIIYTFKFVSALLMVIYYDASFAAIALISMPVTLYITRSLTMKMRKNNVSSAAMNAKMSGFNQEAFSNIQTIKAFDMISLYTERLKQLQKEYMSMRLGFQKMAILISLLTTLVGMIVSNLSYGWGIFRVWSGAISYGTMTMFLGLSATLTTTMNSMVSLIPTAISLSISAGRLMDIVEMPREDYSHKDEVKEFFERHKTEGVGMEVRNVDYAYNNGNQVFLGANIQAFPHEVVALVGPSGEGKTTMLRLLLSLINPQSGESVLRAGDEEIPLNASARQLISYVPQGNTMFSGTIAENMRNVKEDATDEEIVAALELACAWDFVSKLPDRINSPIKERGGGFSEGQAQRLSIARAILRKSPILLLDEATSALDVATERKLLRNIMKDEYPRTCILTTHRPTVLETCTRVYTVRDKSCFVADADEIERMIKDF